MTTQRMALLRRLRPPLSALFLLTLAMAFTPPSLVRAATVTVTTMTDSTNACATTGGGTCSLRDAVTYANANGGTDISVPAGTYGLSNNYLGLTANVTTTISGAGAGSTIIDAGGTSRVLRQDGGTLTITGVTVRNGGGDGGDGGAIFAVGSSLTINSSVISGNTGNDGGAMIIGGGTTVTINDTTFSGNTAVGVGGGIRNNGVLNVNRSTFSGNTAQSSSEGGGGIYSHNTMTATNSTFSGNSASAGHGGGVYNFSFGSVANFIHTTFGGNTAPADTGSTEFYNVGSASLKNSIINGACGSGSGASSQGYNLFSGAACAPLTTGDVTDTNPSLGPLQDNGGPTLTQAPGAAAIDKIPNTGGCNNANVTTDQRGVTRPQPNGGPCDIGALEATPNGAPLITGISPSSGPTSGGQSVVISGSGLLNPVSVTFGALAATVTVNTNSRLTVTTPTGSLGAVNVTVTTPGGSTTRNSGYIYTVPPNAVTVTTTGDTTNTCATDGTTQPCSLRDAVTYANAHAGTTISIPAGTYALTTGNDLVISANMTISGAAANTTIIDPAHTSRIFYINSGASVTISGLTMRNGSSNCCTLDGGGDIFNRGTLTILNSTISGGASPQNGGGIANGITGAGGPLTVIGSTISGNSGGDGNAIYNDSGSAVTIINSTIHGNTGGAGVLSGNRGPFLLTHVTLAGNSGNGTYTFGVGHATFTNSINTNGCAGNHSSGDYNIDIGTSCAFSGGHDQSSTNPGLGPLQDNGGPTFTRAPQAGGAAIDKIPNSGANCTATDQRGVTRPAPVGGMCDIGAYEAPSSSVSSFTVTGFPTSATAGVAGSVTVTAIDGFGFPVASYTGTVHFTSTDAQATAGSGLPANYTFVPSDNGAHTFTNGVTLKTAGPQTITATDTVSSSLTGTESGITVNPAAASLFVVAGFPTPQTAGVAGSVTVTVKDAFTNTVTGYTGTVTFTSNDAQSTIGSGLPTNYQFTTGSGNDNGTHTFTNGITLKTAGTTRSITVTDTVTGSITGTQSNITINPGTVSLFSVTGFPTTTVAGAAHDITVTVKDAFSNTVSGYTGTVHFTSNDLQATAGNGLPTDYLFVAGDNGTHTFTGGVTLKTAASGAASITASNGGVTGAQTGITVTPAAASAFIVAGFPTPQTAGIAGNVTVTAKDAFNNTVTGYVGTVTFTSNDAQSTIGSGLPTNYQFTTGSGNDNGVHSFSVTLKTAGTTRSITVTDTVTGSITGTQSSITINPGAASALSVTGFPTVTVAGVAHDITVTAKDAFNNTVAGYLGTVHFTSSDTQATTGNGLPADYLFVAGDNGTHTFTNGVTLKTAASGSDTVTVGDSTLTGSETGITVNPAAANILVVSGFPTTTVAGAAHTITVTAKDAFTNIATGYVGTVTFTSNDAQSTIGNGLPASYTFTTGSGNDNGVHTFSVTLKTAAQGTGSITATDTVTGSITGTQSGITVTPVAASAFIVAGFPTPQTAGIAGNVTVTAKDAFNNTATGYAGTVSFTSNDTQSTIGSGLPTNYTFTTGAGNDNGVHTFSVTLKTAGTTRSITVADTVTGPLTGTQTGITINPAAASTLIVAGFPNPINANTPGTVTVTAKDPFSNTATGYTGTVTFASNDPLATSGSGLPINYHFTSGPSNDNGVHSFTVTLKTAGTPLKSITATDTVLSGITGMQSGIVVNPTFTGVAPASGPANGGATVTLTGSGFAVGATVQFDTLTATNVTVVNDTTITVTTPTHGAGAVDVKVTTAGTTLTLPGVYTYVTVNPLPVPQPSVVPSGPTNPLPPARPPIPTVVVGTPNPLPPPRP